MIKLLHNIPFGFEPTFGNDQNYFEDLLKTKDARFICPDDEDSTELVEKHINNLGFNLEMDTDTFECPSNHRRFKSHDLKGFFKQYDKLVDLFDDLGLKPSSAYKTIEYEGGGHIHISMEKVTEKGRWFKTRFLKNLYIFTINNPELAWLFNCPYDIESSKSLLNLQEKTTVVFNGRNWNDRFSFNPYDDLQYRTHLIPVDYKTCCKRYNTLTLDKSHPIIYRPYYGTIEFRLFMMPRDKKEAKLHFDLAFAIYNYIWNLTIKKKELKEKYTTIEEVSNIRKSQAVKNALETFKLLKLSRYQISLIKKLKLTFLNVRYRYEGLLN